MSIATPPPLLDGMLVHRRVTYPPAVCCRYPFILQGEERIKGSKAPCLRKQRDGRGLNPGSPDPEVRTKVKRSILHQCSKKSASYQGKRSGRRCAHGIPSPFLQCFMLVHTVNSLLTDTSTGRAPGVGPCRFPVILL